MNASRIPHIAFKRAVGAVILAALAGLAVLRSLPRMAPDVTQEAMVLQIGSLPGVAKVLGLKFDRLAYNGQGAAKMVVVDFIADRGVSGEILHQSMRAAGELTRQAVEIYHKIVVTGYRGALDFEAGLPYSSRAVWLSKELVEPLEGWRCLRLPDEKRSPVEAFDRIYVQPVVSARGEGEVEVILDLMTERKRRPAADVNEILAACILDEFEHDNVFSRSPALKSIKVEIASDGSAAGGFKMTRDEHLARDVSRLRADMAVRALDVSAREFAMAEKYDRAGLYTPLLFDAIISYEDKAAVTALREERRRAEDEFYGALFGDPSDESK